MEHAKLEVLARPAGTAPGAPRVVMSSGMSLSFKLPPAYARAQREAAAARQQKVEPAKEQQQDNAPADNEAGEVSWEDRDWDVPSAASSAARELGVALVQGGGEEEWEETAAPDLPDDFPRLLVNLTRLQRQHFPPPPGEEDQVDMSELVGTVTRTLHRHFTQMVEVLFEQKSCFHCTYGSSRAILDGLHTAYPDDVFALVDYPTEIDGVGLHEYLVALERESPWKSVNYLKDCLRRCSRDIKWKRDVAEELELLAEQEHSRWTSEQEQLSNEIDELTRLRDSFKAKLAKMQDDKASSSYLMLRKLEDIETRLMPLLDTFLSEPELDEDECYGMFDDASTGMNVLDMVVAMIFGRLPRDFRQQTTTEEHFQMLFDHHIHIRRLWKKDFGRLPPRSGDAGVNAEADEADAIDEERAIDEYGVNYGEIDEEIQDEVDDALALGESLSASCRIEEDNSSGSSKLSDWETIQVEDSESKASDVAPREETDGYGADYDSDGSDDSEDEFVTVASTAAPASSDTAKLAEPTTSELPPAMARRRRATAERAEKIRKKKAATKKRKKSKKADKQPAPAATAVNVREEEPLFRPFACTRAVGLLRLAKENELF